MRNSKYRLPPLDYQKQKIAYHIRRLKSLGMSDEAILKLIQQQLNELK